MPVNNIANGQDLTAQFDAFLGRRHIAEALESRIDPAQYAVDRANLDPANRAMLNEVETQLLNSQTQRNFARDTLTNSGVGQADYQAEYTRCVAGQPGANPAVPAALNAQRISEYRAEMLENYINFGAIQNPAQELQITAGQLNLARNLEREATTGNQIGIYTALQRIGVQNPNVLLAGQFSRHGDVVGLAAVATQIATVQRGAAMQTIRTNAGVQGAIDTAVDGQHLYVDAIASMYAGEQAQAAQAARAAAQAAAAPRNP